MAVDCSASGLQWWLHYAVGELQLWITHQAWSQGKSQTRYGSARHVLVART